MALYQPIDYTGGVSQFDTMKSGFELGQNLFKNQQAARINEFNLEKAKRDEAAAIAKAEKAESEEASWKNFLATAKTKEDLMAGYTAFPERIKDLQAQIGIHDEQQRQEMFNFGNKIRVAQQVMETDPVKGKEMMAGIAAEANDKGYLKQWNIDDATAFKLLTNPNTIGGIINTIDVATISPKEAFDYRKGIAKDKFDRETEFQKSEQEALNEAMKAAGETNANYTTEGDYFHTGKMSVNSEKIMNNYDNEYNENVGKVSTIGSLLTEIEANPPPSGFVADAYSWVNDTLGTNFGNYAEMRTGITKLINMDVVNALPPGAASEKDVEIIQGGFPKPNASPVVLKNYLSAAKRVAETARDYARFKSSWIATFGRPGLAIDRSTVLDTRVNKQEDVNKAFLRYVKGGKNVGQPPSEQPSSGQPAASDDIESMLNEFKL